MRVNWRSRKWYAAIFLVSLCAMAQTKDPQTTTPQWKLVWSDEFNGANGSPVDSSKWVQETGGGGWGNEELEYYTNRPQNAFLQNGNLVIKAVEEKYSGSDGVSRNYTSARLKTQGKFSQTYGRFEARIKIPRGQGIWPAFWMLGADIDQVPWPACGEIDIMENIGKEPTIVHGTIHGPGYNGANGIGSSFVVARRREVCRRLSFVCGRVGAHCDSFLRRRSRLRDANSRGSAERGEVGLRPSILHFAECGGRRRMAGKSGHDERVSADHVGGLCPRLRCGKASGSSETLTPSNITKSFLDHC